MPRLSFRHSPPRLHIAVALLSMALIAFQLVLMQVLSIVQWYHFAYMVISVALLGFGAAGTMIALARIWFVDRFEMLVPLFMLASGASMACVTGLSQQPFARFDAYLLFVDAGQVGALIVTYLLFFIPFLFGALAIGLVFVRYTERIGRYYFANLLGSGLGGLTAIGMLWIAPPATLPALTAFLPIVAGVLILPKHHRAFLGAIAVGGLILAIFFAFNPPSLVLSEYKDLSRTMTLPDARVTNTRSSPQGLLQVVASPALRHAPGLSLSFTGEIPPQKAVFDNGNWFGAVTSWSRTDTTHLLDFTTAALPYAMRARNDVLVLDAHTGEYVAPALVRGARRVTAVEPNRAALDLLRHDLAAAANSLLNHPAVHVHAFEPRTFLAADTAAYDLIVLPMTGAFGGTVGFTALQEQNLWTKEAFREMWRRLKPGGVIAVSTWMDYPYRYPLRTLATLVGVLADEGVAEPGQHLVAVRSWSTIAFALAKSPLASDEVRNVMAFCDRLSFDPVLLPGVNLETRVPYNQLQDTLFFDYVNALLSPAREAFYASYPFRVGPAVDDRPYFDQFLRWGSLPDLIDQFGSRTVPFFELGLLVVIVTFLQISIAAIVLILAPLLRVGWRGGGKLRTLGYFGGLGLGYMFVEIVLIQRFTLYLGAPLYAAAAAISVILIFSGIGSYVSERLAVRRQTLQGAAGMVAVLILGYALILTPLLQATIAWQLPLKVTAAFLLLAPPAFAMGFPFPLGLRLLAWQQKSHVPWAWGINGCLSVVSTALATMLAVEVGFPMVMVAAAGAYLVAMVSGSKM